MTACKKKGNLTHMRTAKPLISSCSLIKTFAICTLHALTLRNLQRQTEDCTLSARISRPVRVFAIAATLTYCILVDSSTAICWMSVFVILGMSGLFCHFYSIFD